MNRKVVLTLFHHYAETHHAKGWTDESIEMWAIRFAFFFQIIVKGVANGLEKCLCAVTLVLARVRTTADVFGERDTFDILEFKSEVLKPTLDRAVVIVGSRAVTLVLHDALHCRPGRPQCGCAVQLRFYAVQR